MRNMTRDLHAFQEVQELCKFLSFSPEDGVDEDKLRKLKGFVEELPVVKVQRCQSMFIATVYKLFTSSKNLNENKRILMMDTLSEILKKLEFEIKDTVIFFNLYGFLLQEICDPRGVNTVKDISEEYKLSIMKCTMRLMKTFTWDLVPKIYSKEHVPKLSTMLHLCLKLARHEKLRKLRITAIKCILTIAHLEEEESPDGDQYETISDVFVYFLPGIAGALVKICTEDEKCGHGVVVVGLKAWARLVVLCMRSYHDETHDSLDVPNENIPTKRFENVDDINNYLNSFKRDASWYAQHDAKLELCVNLLTKLVTSQHPSIRNELMESCDLLCCYCLGTLPKTSGKAIEVLIALSEDEREDIADKCKVILSGFSEKIGDDGLKMRIVRDVMEQNFYDAITKLPRIFNGLDEREQLAALNLIIGYLSVFKKHRLKLILFSATNLNRILQSLIHVAAMRTDVSLLEEYSAQDLEENPDFRTPWKVFNFHSKDVERKLETVCGLLSQPDISDIVLDYLMEVFVNDAEHRKEVTLIINEVLSSVPCNSKDNLTRVKPFISIYLDEEYWDLSLSVRTGGGAKNCTLGEAQNNVVQICLQIEGIGKMATALKSGFREFLLRVLYVVLEKAGSGNPTLRTAGLAAVSRISKACSYKNVTELINDNSDYFSYHVVRMLKRPVHDEGVLNVLTVVMKHGDVDVLPSLSEIVDGVLMQSCDRYELENASAYLRVFKVFIRWLNITIEAAPPMKTKEEREEDVENFKISNLESLDTDFSDEAVMGKTGEDICGEDVEDESPGYKKPEPPVHIKLIVSILKRSLNFLPSKDQNRKILTLEILRDGVVALHAWEDELLPMVHLIWSPLVNRFKEYETPLVINRSFQLLTTLARLSKDFIRSRTVKEVLPSLSEALKRQFRLSHLKDKGSSYRYTQGYKMQQSVLPELGRLCYDLDAAENGIALFVEAIQPYLSNRQPLGLQESAVDFYKTLFLIDPLMGEKFTKELEGRVKNDAEYEKNCAFILEYMYNSLAGN